MGCGKTFTVPHAKYTKNFRRVTTYASAFGETTGLACPGVVLWHIGGLVSWPYRLCMSKRSYAHPFLCTICVLSAIRLMAVLLLL